mmetsp:Transcript_32336/g.57247  ORF Transcript_32336/g.57247 Transcript_32336/m.57247 type:complete len:251 (-) Transcript_32336:701-1453(-)
MQAIRKPAAFDIVPSVGFCSPVISLATVDFPAPLAPVTTIRVTCESVSAAQDTTVLSLAPYVKLSLSIFKITFLRLFTPSMGLGFGKVNLTGSFAFFSCWARLLSAPLFFFLLMSAAFGDVAPVFSSAVRTASWELSFAFANAMSSNGDGPKAMLADFSEINGTPSSASSGGCSYDFWVSASPAGTFAPREISKSASVSSGVEVVVCASLSTCNMQADSSLARGNSLGALSFSLSEGESSRSGSSTARRL